ncbi:hypothetical protein HHL22_02125 [Hymenobacter sp. RP-2-7]|uniref:Uncharacterized protein n=1 Tax=Hymenobacter polaris TaxID=2682546 RepID=A0A7Y0AB73_9BACT|nr:hypothetical protein [Hymenobacter polaris]NML63992.1 hypothetical protein [Hymenobacter polaris]
MLRTAVSFCLLALLALPLAPAHAQPTWWFWLSKPERHGSRKMAGDFRPVYGTYRLHSHERAARRTMPGNFKPNYASYRYHSRERRGFFSFLHFGKRKPGVTYRRQAGSPSHAAPRRSRTTL